MAAESIIRLSNDLGLSNIHELVAQVAPVIDACRNLRVQKITVDMSDLQFIWPTGLATLTAGITHIAQHECVQSVSVRRSRHARADGYLTRIGFYDFLQLPVEYPWSKRDPTGRFREVVEITSEDMSNEVSRNLVTILQTQAGSIGQQTVNAIQYTFSEIVDNVFHHAQSPVNAIICAQSYPRLQQAEFAIVDCGRGFRLSLLENPALRGRFKTAIEAISLAVQPKVTGRPANNAGEGLFFITELVKQNRGDMAIYSEDGLFKLVSGEVKLYNVPYWSGAIVGLRLGLERPIDMKTLFDQYAPPEEDFELLIGDEEIPF